VVLVLVALGGGGFWFTRGHFKKTALNDGAASINVAANDSSSSAASPPAANGLSVAGGGATNLGQLGASSGGSQGVPGSSSSSTTSNSSSSPSPIDPSTFAQYDKYKDNSSALFGDVQVGSGASLGANQQASILYKGWLTNGTLFDQSKTDSSGQAQPLVFAEGAHQVIAGMEEGVAGMKVGGTRLIIIPPALGYGAQGQGSIPPNAVLVFEVQLLDVH
jgi:FKBP-type peptidyl-prolyl cis-trans isomerase FkpA